MMQSPPKQQETVTELPYALKVFLLLSVGLTIISFVYSIICRRMYLGLPYSFPYYYVPGDMFTDFFSFNEQFKQWGTPAFFDHTSGHGYFMYPAPLVHVFRLFFRLPHPRTCYILALLAVSTALAMAFIQVLRRQGLATMQSIVFVGSTALLSYPLSYEIQRCNIEFVVWLVSTVAVWSFFTGSTTTSAVFIGMAASLKPYPIIFLGLFMPRRRYKGFVLGLATFAAVTIVSLYAIGPTILAAARWDGVQLAAFSKYYVGDVWALGYDHSFFGLVKALTLHWHPNYFAWTRPYSLTVATISVVLYFLRIWGLPITNQILSLSVLSVTLAPFSSDYTLLNLYPAFALLTVLALQAQRRGTGVPYLTTYMVLFAVIFTPESYIIFRGVRYGAQLRAICLIVMLVLALVEPLPEAGTAAESAALSHSGHNPIVT
jgi:hypothetical protein